MGGSPERAAEGLAHDLNNLLTSLIGWAEIARREDLDPARRRAALEVIERCAHQARSMAARCIEGSPLPAEARSRIDIASLIDDVLVLHSIELERGRIEARADSRPGLACDGDRGALFRVLDNLVLNAVDAMPGGGLLRVSAAAAEGGRLRIAVEDSGPGVDPAAAGRLFERSFTTKRRVPGASGSGSGLGLWVSRSIARAHGGDLSHSPAPGGGARFELDLPRSPELPLGSPVPGRAGRPSIPPGIAVLAVDDDEDILEMVRVALTLRGARVVVARDGEEALAACRGDRFDLALLDFSLPGLSGHELGSALAERHPDLPLVVMSGSRIDTSGLPTVADFLKKPFDIDEIQDKVRRIVERRPRG